MSTWALLLGELQWFSEHEKAIWPFRAEPWNIPKSPRQCLITSRSRTASGLPGGFCCSISSLRYFFNPGLNSRWISETSLLAWKFLISSLALFFLKKYLFIWLHQVQLQHLGSSIAAHGLSSCGAWASEVSACGRSSYNTWVQSPCGLWDLSSPTRDRTSVLCIAWQTLNYWLDHEGRLSSLLSFFLWLLAAVRFKQGVQPQWALNSQIQASPFPLPCPDLAPPPSLHDLGQVT